MGLCSGLCGAPHRAEGDAGEGAAGQREGRPQAALPRTASAYFFAERFERFAASSKSLKPSAHHSRVFFAPLCIAIE